MQIVKVSELISHPRNNDFFDDVTGKRWDEFLESVRTSGVIEPIVITEGKVIVSGHQRVRACKELGIEEIMAEIKLYEGDEKKILKDLIETNVRQRGTIGGSDQQIVARVEALKDWYGVHNGYHGNDAVRKAGSTNGTSSEEEIPNMKLNDVLKILGLTEKQYKTAKQITDKAIPEVQQLIEDGIVSRRTVADLISKLTPEEQAKLVDKLPDDVKFSAKSIKDYIEDLRAELVAHTNKAMEDNNKLLGEKKQLMRENNELRAGALPMSNETRQRIDQLEADKRDFYEKWDASKKEITRMRGELDKAIQAKHFAEAQAKGGDEASIALENRISELEQQLDASKRMVNDLNFQISEKDDEIKELEAEKRDGVMRKALSPKLGSKEFVERQKDALMSELSGTAGAFNGSVRGFLMETEKFDNLNKEVLRSLVEMYSDSLNLARQLVTELMVAGGTSDDDGTYGTYQDDYDDDLNDIDLSGLDCNLGA